MKLYIALIFATVFIAFSTAYFFQGLDEDISPTKNDLLTINAIKQKFQETVLPVKIVNFSSLYYNRDRLQLIDPSYTTASESFIGFEDIYFGKQKCFEARNFLRNYDNYDKVWIWEEFRCGMRKLPNNFFSSPPYMHPSGKSYALLAYLTRSSLFQKNSWLKANISLFHALEYEKLGRNLREFDYVYTLFSKLEPETLTSIIKAKGTILGTDYMLARIKYSSLFPILEYRFYERSDLDNFLKSSPYAISNYTPKHKCFYKDGSLCWDYSFTFLLRNANKRNVIFISLSGALTVLFAITLFKKIKAQKIEDDRRRVALQVLTHEFRTPVASLLLNLENLNNVIDHKDNKMQELYLKLSKDSYRLKNLTEMSRNYLKSSRKNAVIEYKMQEIQDFSMLVEEIADDFADHYPDRIEKDITVNSQAVKADTYWISISIKNLIENAIHHGEGKVTIRCHEEKNGYRIDVSDQGSLGEKNLNKLTSEFYKGNKSSGTGLGLNIVKRAVEGMGGKLSLEAEPTTFSIKLQVV